MQFWDVPGGPEPIFEEHQLDGLHGWAAHLQVGIAPFAEALIAAKVFVAHVEATDEGAFAIADDDFPVVSEVQLKTRPPMAVDAERVALDAGFFEGVEVAARELVGADFVE